MNDLSTLSGGAREVFPATRWSQITEAADPSSDTGRAALERFAWDYWRPVYAYFRRKWGKCREEAQDLTQDFFLALAEKNFLDDLSPERGKLRSYIMAALDNFARCRHRRESSLRRGGSVAHFSLDLERDFEPTPEESIEETFRREWAGAVLDQALRDLEEECRASGSEETIRLFLLHEVDRPEGVDLSYEGLARRFGLTVAQVRNVLYRARKRLRDLVLTLLRRTVGGEEEACQELHALFGSRGP